MATDGYPIEAQITTTIEREKSVQRNGNTEPGYVAYLGKTREAPAAGEAASLIWRATEKLLNEPAERAETGKSRKEAIYAATTAYKGDIAVGNRERKPSEAGGKFDHYRRPVEMESPYRRMVKTTWRELKFISVAVDAGTGDASGATLEKKLDFESDGYNSSRYVQPLHQAMNLASADRDFYYGDPYFCAAEPMDGLYRKNTPKNEAS